MIQFRSSRTESTGRDSASRNVLLEHEPNSLPHLRRTEGRCDWRFKLRLLRPRKGLVFYCLAVTRSAILSYSSLGMMCLVASSSG